MRLVFFGSPDEAAVALEALVASPDYEVALVVSQPDRRRGRGGASAPTPVKAAAGQLGLPVVTPARAADALDDIAATGAEIGVVVAFGQLLPPAVIDAFAHGLVNIHFSLLPRWRGAAPVERAIMAGDTETGVCLMEIAEELDAGGVYAEERVPIGPADTAASLRAALAVRGARLLVDRLADVPSTEPRRQSGEPTYARKLSPEEFEIDWSRPAGEIDRLVRAGNPAPGAWTRAAAKRLKVLVATPVPGDAVAGVIDGDGVVGTGEGSLRLETVQPEGKPAMAAADWLRGAGRGVERLGA